MAIKVMLRGCTEVLNTPKKIDANLVSFISWGRLAETLKASGEIKPNEELEAFILGDAGIQYYVKET